MSLTQLPYDELVERHGKDFSFTEKFHDYIRNYDWQAGYNNVVLNTLPRDGNGKILLNDCPENSAFWLMLSACFEDVASELFEKVDNFVRRTVDVSTCDLDSLYSLGELIGIKDVRNISIDYPLEVKHLIESFSVNKSIVTKFGEMLLDTDVEFLSSEITTSTSGTMSGYDISATTYTSATQEYSNDWSDSEIENIISLTGANPHDVYPLYSNFMDNQFFTVLMENVTVENFLEEYYDTIYVKKQQTSSTILDTEEDDPVINDIKIQYNVPENFSAKQEADNIIAGRKYKTDFNESELAVIEAEVERRAEYEKYGNAPENEDFRRFKYEKERLYREYIRFIEEVNILSKSIVIDSDYGYGLDSIEVDDYKFFDMYDDIPPQSGGVPVSGDMINNTVYFLRNICLDVVYQRERIRTTAQKYKHIGTNTILEVLISDYLYKNYSDRSEWNYHTFPELSALSPTFSGIAIGGGEYISDAVFNNVRVIEYVDQTEYLNIETSASQSSDIVNDRYWENGSTVDASDATSADFYSFYKNLGMSGEYEDIKAYAEELYEIGAISATLDTLTSDFIDSNLTGYVEDSNMSGMYLKYFGNTSGDIPWTNEKNQVHPSVALHPFLWSLQEDDSLVFALGSIYNNIVETSAQLISSLYDRIDENGSLINLWQADALTMGSYEDFYQHSSNFDKTYSENEKIDYDGPFIFEALEDYLGKYSSGGSITAIEIDEFYEEWYGHLEINGQLKDKIKEQLSDHALEIIDMADKKIYQFAVDKYGNQYILFKDANDYQTSGELWMRYKNHPLAFPISTTTSDNYQLDISSYYDDVDSFLNATSQVYNFGLMTLTNKVILWVHTAGDDTGNPIPSRSGVMYFMSVHESTSIVKNKFVARRLTGNNWVYDMDSDSAEYIGVYNSTSFDGDVFGIVSRLNYAPDEVFVPDGSGNYSMVFRYKLYNDSFGSTTETTNIASKFALYNTNDVTDLHNRFRLNHDSSVLSIIFESQNTTYDNTPYLYNGTGNNGKYNCEYNTAKQMYHNGFTLIDMALNADDAYPSSYSIKYYNGYNDVGYHSIEAWEGYIGSEHPLISGQPVGQLSTELQQYMPNADMYIGMEFLGMSDPSTSARFDIDEMQYLCYNSNEEYLGLYVTNIYPTWGDATFAWESTISGVTGVDFTKWVPLSGDSLIDGDYIAWNSTNWVYKLFTEPEETIRFATLASDELYYNVTVTYKGRGCQKFQVDMEPNTKLNQNVADVDFAVLDPTYYIYSTHYANIVDIDPLTGSGSIVVDILGLNKYNKLNNVGSNINIQKDEFGSTDIGTVSGDNGPNQLILNVDDVSLYTINEKVSLIQY